MCDLDPHVDRVRYEQDKILGSQNLPRFRKLAETFDTT